MRSRLSAWRRCCGERLIWRCRWPRAKQSQGAGISQLAGALSLVLVGVPVFLLHWWLAQRLASQENEERTARARAIFLYGSVLATGIPVAQNYVALINRLLSLGFGLTAGRALVGGNQTLSDNLIAILMNTIAVAYLIKVIRHEWKAQPQARIRGRYQTSFSLYLAALRPGIAGLWGVQQTIAYIIGLPQAVDGSGLMLADGLASLLVGAAVWAFFQREIEMDSGGDQQEQESLLRMAILFILALAGVVLVLGSSGLVLYVLLRGLFGTGWSFGELLAELSYPFSVAVSAGIVWAFYGRLFTNKLICSRLYLSRSYYGAFIATYYPSWGWGQHFWAHKVYWRLYWIWYSAPNPYWAPAWLPVWAVCRPCSHHRIAAVDLLMGYDL